MVSRSTRLATGGRRLTWLGLMLASCSNSPATLTDSGPPPQGGSLLIDGGFTTQARVCAVDAQCDSGVCGSNGFCCNQACLSVDPLCGTNSCLLDGTCAYPSSTTTCGNTCAAGTLYTHTCDGNGGCNGGSAAPCPSFFGCALGGTACASRCADDSDCAPTASCASNGQCLPRLPTGFCSANDQCLSGICGISGQGACCSADCKPAESTCGATGCDPASGACIYAARGSDCGAAVCAAATLEQGQCDGNGVCATGPASACPALLQCESDGRRCKVACSTTADCTGEAFCDVGIGGKAGVGPCCPVLGNTLYVDNLLGGDGACCGGAPGAGACATLTRAMQLVREANAYGAILSLSNNSDPNGQIVWGDTRRGAAAEPFPVRLGHGVTLAGNGAIFQPDLTEAFGGGGFSDCSGAYSTFVVSAFDEEGDGGSTVTLQNLSIAAQPGTQGLIVGPPPQSLFTCQEAPSGAIRSFPVARNPGHATLDQITLSNSNSGPAGLTGPLVSVGRGSSLTLGPGPVNLQLSSGLDALQCAGIAGQPAEVSDDPNGTSVLTIAPTTSVPSLPYADDGGYAELQIEPYCHVRLTQGPSLGAASGNSCIYDQFGAIVNFDSTLVFGSAQQPGTIHCMQFDGIMETGQQQPGDLPIPPSVDVEGASIRYNDASGIHLQGGSLTTANTQLVDNNVGLEVEGTGLAWQLGPNGPGPQYAGAAAVTLGLNTVVACNGFSSLSAPVPFNYRSFLYSYTPPGTRQARNSGADVWDQNTAIQVHAPGLAWTDYQGRAAQTSVCDPTCFYDPTSVSGSGPCTCLCRGPNCPSSADAGIGDGLDVVAWMGASVDTSGGTSLDPSYCPNLASGGL